MRDHLGLYYYPNPAETSARVYVREENGSLLFRLWQRDHPEVWERHGWLPLETIRAAAAAFSAGRSGDPMRLYDEHVARALLAHPDD